MTEYFSFDLGTREAGLLRRTLNGDGLTLSIEVVQGGQWVDDPDAIRYFWGYGGDQLEPVPLPESEARDLARSLGVSF